MMRGAMNEPGRAGRHRAGSLSWEWSIWRLRVAGGLLGLLVLVLGVSALTPALRVCEQAADAAETCRPLGWEDPVVLMTLVLALGAGFPDLKRLELPGFAAEREAGLSQSADLEQRVKQLEGSKIPEWYSETKGENERKGESDGGPSAAP